MSTDGILINGGTIASVVHGFNGAAPTGQTFLAVSNVSGLRAGQLSAPVAGSATLAAGLTVTSTSGNWTATFPALTDAQGNSIPTFILAELSALSLSSNATFADGGATVQWPDNGGTLHTLTPAQFQAFAKAHGAFTGACRNYINGVPGAAVPVTTETIV